MENLSNDFNEKISKPTILYVDPEVHNINAFVAMLRREYHIIFAFTATKALEILETQSVSIIVSAKKLSDMRGLNFLAATVSDHPMASKLIVSDYPNEDVVSKVIIFDYLITPWDPVQLKSILKKAHEAYLLKGVSELPS